ncbi:unnamed protein product [Amoebophrya sp. A120]|nr:unnamed protein product [Amoebophrya sp. A120]|eukprot:GSA120T00002853001.1
MIRHAKAPDRMRIRRRPVKGRKEGEESAPTTPATPMDHGGSAYDDEQLYMSPRLNQQAIERFEKFGRATENFLAFMENLEKAVSTDEEEQEMQEEVADVAVTVDGENAPGEKTQDTTSSTTSSRGRAAEPPTTKVSPEIATVSRPRSSSEQLRRAISKDSDSSKEQVPVVASESGATVPDSSSGIPRDNSKADSEGSRGRAAENIKPSGTSSPQQGQRRHSAPAFIRTTSQVLMEKLKAQGEKATKGKNKRQLVFGGKAVVDDSTHDIPQLRKQSAKDALRALRTHLAKAKPEDITNGRALVELLFGAVAEVVQTNLEDDSTQDWYRKTAGMHTVQKWLENYQKHPYGWGALMMIHGTDEVCFRLRTKVENYAVYAALFLSASIVLILAPQDSVGSLCEKANSEKLRSEGDPFWWVCHMQQRIYFYSLAGATCSHVLAILLAMAFINAFNEAGRDCDIIRMFGEGKGYLATVKCEKAFTYGLCLLFLALFDAVWIFLSIFDAVGLFLVLGFVCYYGVYKETVKLLFESSSIMWYWRWGRGHASGRDPFVLSLPIERLQQKTAVSRLMHAQLVDDVENIWNIT